MCLVNSVEKSVTRHRQTVENLLDYASLNRNDDVFNDVTIKAGDESIRGHRLVLSCFSTVFEKMFKVEMREKYERDVKIDGFDGKAIKSLIDYIYNGSIDISNANVVKLLQGADYLQLQEVKEFCFEFLASIIASDNCIALLKIAKLYEDDKITHQVYRYMSDNFNEVTQSGDFKNLSHDDVKELITNLNRSSLQECSVYKGIMIWIKHEVESRKSKLFDLFRLIDIDKLNRDFMEEAVLKDDLVQNDIECHRCLLSAFVARVGKMESQITEYRHSKVVSIGGGDTERKVQDVHSLCGKTSYPSLLFKFENHCCVKWNGFVYAIGGWLGSTKVCRMDIKNKNYSWKEVAGLNAGRDDMGATVHNGTLVVAGGNGEYNQGLTSCEYYVAVTNEWKETSSMFQARSGNALVSCGGWLYALGGRVGENCLSSVERLSDINGTWKKSESMLKPRYLFAAVNCAHAMYAIGGKYGKNASTATKSVEKYYADGKKWLFVSDMNTERCAHAACVMHGKIFVVGGLDAKGRAVKTIECYDPQVDSWSIVGETEDKLYYHSLVSL